MSLVELFQQGPPPLLLKGTACHGFQGKGQSVMEKLERTNTRSIVSKRPASALAQVEGLSKRPG